MTHSFVDYHCHILPALDDGASTLQESLKIAQILEEFGFGTVHCTPHRIKGCFDNDPERVERATRSLQEILDQSGISLRLMPGTEHYLDEFLIDQVTGALVVGGNYLLVEAPFKCDQQLVLAMAANLRGRGLAPLFAHPERCSAFAPPFREKPSRGLFSFARGGRKELDIAESLVLRLRDAGCRFQGNVGSFAGVYGSDVQQRALFFLVHGIYSCIGSDAHRSDRLSSVLSAGYRAIADAVGEESTIRLMQGGSFSKRD